VTQLTFGSVPGAFTHMRGGQLAVLALGTALVAALTFTASPVLFPVERPKRTSTREDDKQLHKKSMWSEMRK
jgi:hypothetical protein